MCKRVSPSQWVLRIVQPTLQIILLAVPLWMGWAAVHSLAARPPIDRTAGRVESSSGALGASGSTGAAPLFAPSIDATKRDSLEVDADGDGKADPSDTLRYSVVVRNAGTSDATGVRFTDNLDPNTTLVPGSLRTTPLAGDDSYSATGNVQLTVSAAGGLLDNDVDPDGTGGVVAVAATLTSTQGVALGAGGEVTINADGSFTYNPPPGFEGSDSFSYTIQDGDGNTATATATITVSEVVWFIRNTAPAGGDGRFADPFNSLSAFMAKQGNGGPTDPAAGDYVFVYAGDGSTTNLNTGITLLGDQLLIGEGAGLSVGDLTIPPGTAPRLSNTSGAGITLASNNTVRGLIVQNTSGPAILGSSFGTLTASGVTINTTNTALSLNNGTANAAFTSVTSSSGVNNVSLTSVNGALDLGGGALSGATGAAFSVNGGSASITTTATIQTSATGARLVSVVNKSGGTVTFSGAASSTSGPGTGVYLNNNSGATVTFSGGLTLSTASNPAFTATGGGTVNVTGSGNTLATTTGTALNVANTTIGSGGLTFRSISVDGAANGIILNNTGSSKGLVVTGTGTTDGSGGTIQNVATRGASFMNATGISLSNMTFSNTSTTDSGAACAGLLSVEVGNAGCNAAIHLDTVSNVTLDNVHVNGSAQEGINARQVTNFDLLNSRIENAGGAVHERGLNFQNLFGAATIQGTTFTGNYHDNARIQNNIATSLTLTVDDSDFNNSTQGSGLLIGTDSVGNITVSVTNSGFDGNYSGGLPTDSRDTSTLAVTVEDSSFTNNNDGVQVAQAGSSTASYVIRGNTILNNAALGILASMAANSTAGATIQGLIDDNAITVPNEAAGDGIRVFTAGAGTHTSLVQSNVVTYTNGYQYGIYATAQEGSGELNATLLSNEVTLSGANPLDAIRVQAGAASGDANSVCADIRSNTATGAPIGFDGIRLRARFSTGVELYKGPSVSTTPTDVLQDNNTASSVLVTETTVGQIVLTTTACPQPNVPVASIQTEPARVQLAAVAPFSLDGEPIDVVSGLEPGGDLLSLAAPSADHNLRPAGAGESPNSVAGANPLTMIGPRAPEADGPKLAGGLARPLFQTPPDVELGPFDLSVGKAITITFEVTVAGPPISGVTEVRNQGEVSGSNFATLLTDDPDTPAADDATVTTLEVEADLEISKTDGQTSAVPGTPLTYVIVATNNGPNHVVDATVTDDLPADLTAISWTCTASTGASCSASGSGDINDAVDLEAGGTVTYTVSATIDPGATGTLSNTATIAAPAGITDGDSGNDAGSDSDTLLTPQVDVTLSGSESTDPVVAGSGAGNLTYVITATNNGPSDAVNLAVETTLTLPAGVTLDSATPSAGSITSGAWTIPTLEVGESGTLTVTLTVAPDAAAGTDIVGFTASATGVGAGGTLVDTADDSASESTSIVREVDLRLSTSESTDPVVAGSGAGNLTYVVTVTNAGPSDASGVVLTDTLVLPAGVSLDSITASGGTSFAGGEWTVGELAAGASETLTIVLTAGASAAPGADLIANSATVTAVNEPEVSPGDESATERTSIAAAADLAVSKHDDRDPAVAGELLTYTIAITNNGPSDARAVVATDTLPAGLSLLATTGCLEDPGGTPTCSLGTVAAGESVSYTVSVSVGATLTGTLTNEVAVGSITPEENPGDESAAESTEVQAEVDLRIAKHDDPDPAIAGLPLTYTVAVTNSGPSVATGIVVTDGLPAEFAYSGDSCGGSPGSVWSWNVGTLAAGASRTCVLTGTVAPGTSGTITNTAAVASNATDRLPANDTITETTTVFDNLFSVGDVAVTEGDTGTVTAAFVVTRTSNIVASSVEYTTGGGTATAGSDYTPISGTLTFGAGGPLTETVSVTVAGDTVVERDESFFLTLANPVNGAVDDGTGRAAILNDDSGTLAIGDLSQEEGDSGTTTYTFTVTLSSDVDTSVEVDAGTADDSAIAGSDYAAISDTLTFDGVAGETRTLTVAVNGDETVELDEAFLVTLTDLQAAGRDVTIARGQGSGTIVNDDSATVSIADVARDEGDSGTTTYTFSVTLSAGVDTALSVEYASADGSAEAGSDYDAASGTLAFAGTPGEIETITVDVSGDEIVELTETFSVTLGNLQAGGRAVSLSDDLAVGTITNDDSATLDIADVTRAEGDSGATTFTFSVTLSAEVDTGLTLDYSTGDDTATAGNDYTPVSGTLAFTGAAGETRTVSVDVAGDTVVEEDEDFFLDLGNLQAGGRDVLLSPRATGTIANDDSTTIRIADVTLDEGDSGSTPFDFAVSLSNPVAENVTVQVDTAGGTAGGGTDYVDVSGQTVTFTAGGSLTQTVTVDVVGETLVENDESFEVNLSDARFGGVADPTRVTIADSRGLGTIANDDSTALSIDDVTVAEPAGSAEFTVTLSTRSALETRVEFATSDGSATAGSDYTPVSGTLTIPAGEITGTISVPIIDDGDDEPLEETFTVALSNAVNATIDDGEGTGTIVDDENTPPTLSDVAITSPIDENGLAQLSGRSADPDATNTFTLTVDWGDGSSPETFTYPAGTTAFTETHQYLDDDPSGTPSDSYNVALTLADSTGDSDTDDTSVRVENVAPALSDVAVGSPVDENGLATLSGTISDPGTQDSFELAVDWGDGAVITYTYAAGTTAFTETHRYLDDDPSGTPSDTYTVALRLTDDDTGSSTASATLEVVNVAPRLEHVAATPLAIEEGNRITVTGTIVDPGTLDTYSLTIDWGDGTVETYPYPAGATGFVESHTYADEKLNTLVAATTAFEIELTLADDDGGTGTARQTVEVGNAGPRLSGVTITRAIAEGEIATLTGGIVEPGVEDAFTLRVDWGDGSVITFTYGAGTTAFTETHQYLDDRPSGTPAADYTPILVLMDDGGASDVVTTSLSVANVAPVLVDLAVPATIEENEILTVTGTISDAGSLDTFDLTIDWGDGTAETLSYPPGSTAFTATHRYRDDDPTGTPSDSYALALTVTDDDAGAGDGTLATTVVNVAPNVEAGPDQAVALGQPVELAGTFLDPGPLDNHTIHWDFGDGVTATGTLTPSHTYAEPGVYTVTLTVADDDGGTGADTLTVSVTRRLLFFPLIIGSPLLRAPDLVVETLEVTEDGIRVVVKNQGDAPVTGGFWVDVYIDPDPVPAQVNQTWQLVAEEGLVWGVTASALPLGPGESLTLTIGDDYYVPSESRLRGPIPAGTPVYAQVDSAHANTSYGAVRESHEIVGGPYNNIGGPVTPRGTLTRDASSTANDRPRPRGLPPRP